jgi:hypothetical protein
MAISKKGKRKITVGKDIFYWIYKFQKEILRLTIMIEDKTLSRLIYNFNCKDYWLYPDIRVWDFSPNIVRQAIEYGLKNGWNPAEKGKDFIINEVGESFDLTFKSLETRQSKI